MVTTTSAFLSLYRSSLTAFRRVLGVDPSLSISLMSLVGDSSLLTLLLVVSSLEDSFPSFSATLTSSITSSVVRVNVSFVRVSCSPLSSVTSSGCSSWFSASVICSTRATRGLSSIFLSRPLVVSVCSSGPSGHSSSTWKIGSATVSFGCFWVSEAGCGGPSPPP